MLPATPPPTFRGELRLVLPALRARRILCSVRGWGLACVCTSAAGRAHCQHPCRLLGCRYTKRAMITGVYSATELYMLTDASPGGLGLHAGGRGRQPCLSWHAAYA